jgi:hypothetical protein
MSGTEGRGVVTDESSVKIDDPNQGWTLWGDLPMDAEKVGRSFTMRQWYRVKNGRLEFFGYELKAKASPQADR